MKKIFLGILCGMLLLTGCANNQDYSSYEHPIVSMEFEDFGTIKIELYPDVAQNTVANFVNLIESGFYDGNSIHRVSPGFVIQGGDPDGNGTGGPGYAIKGEFSENGFNNELSHERGVISMARSSKPNSAGSQFFIVLDDQAIFSLDKKYAGFGKVIEGMDIVDKMVDEAVFDRAGSEKLKENYVIKKVTVDTKGHTYKVKKIAKES